MKKINIYFIYFIILWHDYLTKNWRKNSLKKLFKIIAPLHERDQSTNSKIFIKTADGKLNQWLVCFCAAMDRLRYTHYRTWFITLTSHSLKKQKVENKMQPRWRDSFTKQITCWHKHQYINMAGNEQRENNEKRGNQSNHPLTPYQLMNNNHPT